MDTEPRMSTGTKPHVADVAMAEAVDQEHALGFREAIKLYPTAVGWSLFVSLGVIMLAFDPQIVGSMYAMPQFQKDFGYESGDGEVWVPCQNVCRSRSSLKLTFDTFH